MANDNAPIIAIADYHSQPPIETPAETWTEAQHFDADTPVSEIFEWADRAGGLGCMRKLRLVQSGRGEKPNF